MASIDDRKYQGKPVSIPPPVATTETELPFLKLGWEKFECLCRDIVQAHGFENVHRYGESGQPQEGIDLTGDSPAGVCTAFQVKRKKELTASELEKIVGEFAKGAMAGCAGKFVVCMSREANERKLLDKLAELKERYSFPIELWGAEQLTHLLSDKEYLIRRYFGDDWANKYFGTSKGSSRSLSNEVSETLRRGLVAAFGFTAKVEEVNRLSQTSPEEAAGTFGEVAEGLRERFPANASHFDLLRAKSLKAAGNADASHDALMELAVRNLVEQAEPQLFPGVASALRDLHDAVDETRQTRAAAVCFFEQWHEQPQSLKNLAQCFDNLGPDDEYAPVIAMLVAEAAVADCKFGVVHDRVECLQRASERGDKQTALRVRLAMADAGVEGAGKALIDQAVWFWLPTQAKAYVILRTARRSAWAGESKHAEQQYRMAVQLGAEADLDLDIEKALWSLTALGGIRTIEAETVERIREHAETNRLALAIQGSRSYVPLNPRTRERAFGHLVNDRLPDAHLWIRFRLIESIRSGSLMDEFDSRALLARVYDQSDKPVAALEQGLLSGDNKRVKDLSSRLKIWPECLADMVNSPAMWVRQGALTALEKLGDLAPSQTARRLARTLIGHLRTGDMVQVSMQALQAVVLEADDSDLEQLMPVLERFAPRKPNTYRLTDQGVSVVAARLYRFRPAYRRRAASVLAEVFAYGSNGLAWVLDDCGGDLGELVTAFERVSERPGSALSGPLSDLEILNSATREIWFKRLRFVEQYPLEERSNFGIGGRYDIPKQFLVEQGEDVAIRYIQKLVAIGSNCHEPRVNRTNALASAFRVVEVLPPGSKAKIFGIVKPLIYPDACVSTVDKFEAGMQDPLGRFQFSSATEDDVRAKALAVLARSAVETDARSDVVATAHQWLGSESVALQGASATALLVLSNSSSPGIQIEYLAGYSNHRVRGAAVDMLPNLQQRPDAAVLDRLASDPDKRVRIRVAYVLAWLRDADPDAYERIGPLLSCDQSGVVRALAAEVLGAANQQGA
ncbi:MAG: hypothetical protein F4Y80_01380 [Caldilineaceae bacterium SB0665_bin_21]|nr:hypothetical protein [Caldilineaceae bacterium SB0665_bin_21]